MNAVNCVCKPPCKHCGWQRLVSLYQTVQPSLSMASAFRSIRRFFQSSLKEAKGLSSSGPDEALIGIHDTVVQQECFYKRLNAVVCFIHQATMTCLSCY